MMIFYGGINIIYKCYLRRFIRTLVNLGVNPNPTAILWAAEMHGVFVSLAPRMFSRVQFPGSPPYLIY